MRITITPSHLSGDIVAPPSKSYSHRLMLSAALTEKPTTISSLSWSEDISATLDCISSLGIPFTKDSSSVTFRANEQKKPSGSVFPCRESGSTLRFMIPIASALCDSALFSGTERLFARGIGEYEKILPGKNVNLSYENGMIRTDGRLMPGRFELDGSISSQFVTGLLFALPLLDKNSEIVLIPPVESRPYIDMTLDVLHKAGIVIEEKQKNRFFIPGNQKYRQKSTSVEGDWSNAAFFLALSHLGNDISVQGLNDASVQGDKVSAGLFAELEKEKAVADLSDCPDLAPIMFAFAALKHGGKFTGTHRLRIKESDRASAMAEELEKFGIRVDIDDDEVVVHGGKPNKPTEILNGHNDHRIVMALSVLCTVTGGTIDGIEAVNKSYPDFFTQLTSLGAEVLYET